MTGTDPRALPAGQIIALLALHGGPQGDVAALVSKLVPRGRATPTSTDYGAILAAGLADMTGGLHLTLEGAEAVGAILRTLA